MPIHQPVLGRHYWCNVSKDVLMKFPCQKWQCDKYAQYQPSKPEEAIFNLFYHIDFYYMDPCSSSSDASMSEWNQEEPEYFITVRWTQSLSFIHVTTKSHLTLLLPVAFGSACCWSGWASWWTRWGTGDRSICSSWARLHVCFHFTSLSLIQTGLQ